MRQLIAQIEPQSWAPMGPAEESLDYGSSLIDGLYSLCLPSGLDPRTSYNAAHLSGRRAATIGESASAYYRRRAQSSPNPSTVVVPGGLGGNVPTPFGRAFAYSNEQAAMSVGSLGYVPMYSGDGTWKSYRSPSGSASIASMGPDSPRSSAAASRRHGGLASARRPARTKRSSEMARLRTGRSNGVTTTPICGRSAA